MAGMDSSCCVYLQPPPTNQLQADKLRDYKRRVQRERRTLLASIGIDASNPPALQALVAKLVGEEAEAGGATKTGPADRQEP